MFVVLAAVVAVVAAVAVTVAVVAVVVDGCNYDHICEPSSSKA